MPEVLALELLHQISAGDEAADELRAFCKDRLAGYKYPRVIRFVEGLPKGATGKILKRELRDRDDAGAS